MSDAKPGTLPVVPCPSCGTDVRGRFCPACGTLARETPCRSCGTVVAAGDRFCGECGAPVRDGVPASAAKGPWRPSTTWKVATAAFALTLAAALYIRYSESTPSATAAPAMSAAAPGGSVLSLPPQEQADRLFNRVMRLSEEGKRDSVALFAPMALQVYENLRPWDQHQRFDVGTLALAAGMLDLARAQADTMLQRDPDHLLGLALLSRVGRAAGRAADVQRADERFARIVQTEVRKAPEKTEYEAHKADIEVEVRRLAGDSR